MKTGRQIVLALKVEIARIHKVAPRPVIYWLGRYNSLKDLLDWIEGPRKGKPKPPKKAPKGYSWPSSYLRKK